MTERKPKMLTYEELKDNGVPFSKVTLFRMEKEGRFPKRVRLGRRNHIRWVADEIEAWVSGQIEARSISKPGRS